MLERDGVTGLINVPLCSVYFMRKIKKQKAEFLFSVFSWETVQKQYPLHAT